MNLELWRQQASCRGASNFIWYTENWKTKNYSRKAKQICNQCPVQNECLTTALLNDEHYGIWGGLTPLERKQLIN